MKKIINTFEYDSKTFQSTINNIIGDCSYKTNIDIISNKKNKYNNSQQKKSNKLNNNEDKIKLKIRYRVKNVFSLLNLNN